jgi:hypothetical protein
MRLFYTVIFLFSLLSAAFAREESVLARVTSYWAGEGESGKRALADDCAPDIARSIQNEFRTAVKWSSLIAPAPRSIPDRRLLIAKPLAHADGLQANAMPSWSTDSLKQSERRWRGPTRIRTL